jgi:Serine dehydrogenase proteinase
VNSILGTGPGLSRELQNAPLTVPQDRSGPHHKGVGVHYKRSRGLGNADRARLRRSLFFDLLDKIGPTKRISLLLHTNGGQTSAAWRLINLIRTFCDELEVLIPLKALSAGTLISLGADKVVMTKQAALGPIDPSLTHALNPVIPFGNQAARVPVSVEAVRGYLDAVRQDLGVKNQVALANVMMDLSNKVHPLVLGEIFRSRAQIRFLANKLIGRQVKDPRKVKQIIDFLCADSGSHDYTMNRREAHELGLRIEKPTNAGLVRGLRVAADFRQCSVTGDSGNLIGAASGLG